MVVVLIVVGLCVLGWIYEQQEKTQERNKQLAIDQERQRREFEEKRKQQEEETARRKWKLFHEARTAPDLEKMSGREFEHFLAGLLSKMGHREIQITPTNDQGGDIVCSSPNGDRIVIQAKRWKDSVGNGAVQELLGAMLFYSCASGMIITNSTFTQAARLLARKDPRITLCDRQWVQQQIVTFSSPAIPPFDWDEYNRVVKDLPLEREYSTPRSGAWHHGKYRRKRRYR